MDRITSRFLIYGGMPDDSVLMQLSHVCRTVRGGEYDLGEVTSIVYAQIKRILEISTDFAFDKNLWQNYLTYLLVTAENPFTLTAEKTGGSDGSVNHFANNDFAAFIELFHYDFSWLEEILQTDVFSCITNYKAIEKPALMYNGNVSEKVRALSDKLAEAGDADAFFRIITGFYRDYGVGMFGLNKAFRIAEAPDGSVIFKPVANMEHVVLDDLHGYELQKQKLIDNTEAFVEGRKANNVLLFGDSGTGKSTSIKAIVNEYYDRGLRMIEIYKYQFRNLSQLISQIKNRNYKFIIYMDDLSFEEDESEYKFLKAVIEGGLETKPSNILIYATSNRRHLIREMWTDRDDMEQNADIHRSDTMEEKLSLANRFGVTIGYYKPDRKLYHDIVRALADRNGIEMEDEQLFLLSDQWEMSHGGVSGRTADQFINHLNGARHH
ncbi:MAG: ATP-binding protein [Lachnospiraceae bacterium]|nr:ATP-binding protein [Lachnospiraceae bacterium]